MKISMTDIQIKRYQEEYAAEISHLFHTAIHAIDPKIYSKAQQEAWCSTPPDWQKWAERWEQKKMWMAMRQKIVVGFIGLEDGGYIDHLYVHPDFQGRGIATMLYEHIMTLADRQALTRLTVDASKVSMPLFKKWGFSIVKKNGVEREGEILINFHMEKQLSRLDTNTGDKNYLLN